MTEACIDRASPFKVVIPGDRMVVTHLTSFEARSVERKQDMDAFRLPRIAPKTVPFIGPHPFLIQMPRCWMIMILNRHPGFLDLWMALKPGADELAIPRPVVAGIGRGM